MIALGELKNECGVGFPLSSVGEAEVAQVLSAYLKNMSPDELRGLKEGLQSIKDSIQGDMARDYLLALQNWAQAAMVTNPKRQVCDAVLGESTPDLWRGVLIGIEFGIHAGAVVASRVEREIRDKERAGQVPDEEK